MVTFGTLLPFASTMTVNLQLKKAAMVAAETAYQGAITFSAYGLTEGTRQVKDVDYDWVIDEQSVCVSYTPFGEELSKCVDF
ncbi:hypothetical protein [Filibacter tadaridae]